jgi:ketosteroid isomerase-like protein
MRLWIAPVLILAACAAPQTPPHNPSQSATDLLSASADAWNRGDLEAFVSDYAHDSTTTFMAGGQVQYGWEWIHDNYTRWWELGNDRDSLRFENVAGRGLGSDYILATARFVLFRGDSITGSGPFTLVLQRIDGAWKIVHDHTSSD